MPEEITVQAHKGWNANLRAVLRELEDAALLLDEQGDVLALNRPAHRLLGWDDDLLGKSIEAIFRQDKVADLVAPGEPATRTDAFVFTRTDESIPVRRTATRLTGPDGESRGYTIILRDIREKTDLKRQLVRADRLATIGLLASTVAHEVGTPLNVILGRAEMLEELLESNPAARRQVETIADQIQRISAVVSRLLTFSREAGPGDEPVQLNRVLLDVIAFVEPRMQSQNVTLKRELDEALPVIAGNIGHFHQVFLNLVMNALDAMPDGGELTLTTRHCQAAAAIPNLTCNCLQAEVNDTGRGIPSGDLSKIFDPFFTTKGRGRGTGLGLAISEEIVRKYNGQVIAGSNEAGGARFLINLPYEKKKQGLVS